MANSPRASINYKPRVSEEEAYERLPITLKRALQEAVIAWSSYWVLRHFEKHGLPKTIDVLHAADDNFMRKKLQSKRFAKADIVSSYVACRIEPLRTYGIKRNTRVSRGENSPY